MKTDLNSILPENCLLRHATPSDHAKIIEVLKDWWDGRDLIWMIPKLFLNHFYLTSFIIEKENSLIAFLVGFDLVPGDADMEGIPITNDYNKPGDPKVLFRIKI